MKIFSLILFVTGVARSFAFAPKYVAVTPGCHRLANSKGFFAADQAATAEPELTEPETRVYELLEELHQSNFLFRIVVVGNGAILETTSKLGPKMKLSQSPTTSANLVTFASEDASFEFHLQTARVAKIALVEKESPVTGKTMRILRFLTSDGASICSLILSDDSKEAVEWYSKLIASHGSEMQL